ncbi:Ran-binding protein 3 [Gaertneriomyces sp. JEL0708]|nr:Ran-binding protein 3 [Gaertneriomyces sp. JEL0708]
MTEPEKTERHQSPPTSSRFESSIPKNDVQPPHATNLIPDESKDVRRTSSPPPEVTESVGDIRTTRKRQRNQDEDDAEVRESTPPNTKKKLDSEASDVEDHEAVREQVEKMDVEERGGPSPAKSEEAKGQHDDRACTPTPDDAMSTTPVSGSPSKTASSTPKLPNPSEKSGNKWATADASWDDIVEDHPKSTAISALPQTPKKAFTPSKQAFYTPTNTPGIKPSNLGSALSKGWASWSTSKANTTAETNPDSASSSPSIGSSNSSPLAGHSKPSTAQNTPLSKYTFGSSFAAGTGGGFGSTPAAGGFGGGTFATAGSESPSFATLATGLKKREGFDEMLSTPVKKKSSSVSSSLSKAGATRHEERDDADEAGSEGQAEENDERSEGNEKKEAAKVAEVKVESGEEDEDTLYATRCKLHIWDSTTWRERGRGNVKLNTKKEGPTNGRLVMRVEGSLKLILNMRLYKGMKVSRRDEKYVEFLGVNLEDGKVTKMLLTFKNKDIAQEFVDAVEGVIFEIA